MEKVREGINKALFSSGDFKRGQYEPLLEDEEKQGQEVIIRIGLFTYRRRE
jgi:hypothetical protein